MSNQAIEIWNKIKANGINAVLFAMGLFLYIFNIKTPGLVAIWAAIIITIIYGLLGAVGILKRNEIIALEPFKIDLNKKKNEENISS